MSVVTHKYTPAGMPKCELKATFAAREHTVAYLLKALRDQRQTGTLSSFLITGPRGAGKSTVIYMTVLRMREDPDLNACWIPVLFPEEQFEVASLRDLLAATLRALVAEQCERAEVWLERVDAEPDDEQSQQLAITGLRDVARRSGKRLVLFIENLNLLLEQCLDDRMKATLRRLLMTDPFLMIVGSAVHVFQALKRYDEAFFNYFGEVRLGRLDMGQVFELMERRAQFDHNELFLREFPTYQAKVRAMVHLSGGNPRLILMLYELLCERQVTTIVQYLRRLVDELTPLLKDEMESLPPQQRKIIHALMEKGGTAQPTELVGPTRLPLNVITAQLKRLKEAQVVEVFGGGKGRTANYTVPDKLFAIWYQMRYLGQNRRRIEMFVEVLRVWYEDDERLAALRRLANGATDAGGLPQDSAETAQYFAASLKGSQFASEAAELCIRQWMKADLREAAFAYADLSDSGGPSSGNQESPYEQFAEWLTEHGDNTAALEAIDRALKERTTSARSRFHLLLRKAQLKARLEDVAGEIDALTAILQDRPVPAVFLLRADANRRHGDLEAAVGDYTAVADNPKADATDRAKALGRRAGIHDARGEASAAIRDYTVVIEWGDTPSKQRARALVERAVVRRSIGELAGAIDDLSSALALPDLESLDIANAMVNRGITRFKQGDTSGGLSDLAAAAELPNLPANMTPAVRLLRGFVKGVQSDTDAAILDLTAAIDDSRLPNDLRTVALATRGLVFHAAGKARNASRDLLAALEAGIADIDLMLLVVPDVFQCLQETGEHGQGDVVRARLITVINDLASEPARRAAVRFLRETASPGLKEEWALTYRALYERSTIEVREALSVFAPVCGVLEGQDIRTLDALPPEQRDFAFGVLQRFEPPGQGGAGTPSDT